MDKIPSGGGMPGGAGVDGAFERFLTAAIATIITIMFSWRLLAEEEEAMGVGSGATGSLAPRQFQLTPSLNLQQNSLNKLKMSSAKSTQPVMSEIDISDDEVGHTDSTSRSLDCDQIDRELVVYDHYSPEQHQQLEAIDNSRSDDSCMSVSTADDSLTADTLTTWDEYKWEEETGQETETVIKTRRSVRDFVKSPSLNTSTNNSDQPDTLTISVHTNSNATPPSAGDVSVSPSVPFSQRFANFEYKDTGGDSGYIDLYPDVESDSDVTDSSDDERVYEIQVSDSDSDSDERGGGSFYGVTALDTIMEEYESDVSDSTETTGEGVKRENEGDLTDVTSDKLLNNDKDNDVGDNLRDRVGETYHNTGLSNQSSTKQDDNLSVCDKSCDNLLKNDKEIMDTIDQCGVDVSVNEIPSEIETTLDNSEVNVSYPDQLLLENTPDRNAIHINTPLKCIEAEIAECNLSLGSSPSPNTNGSLMGKKQECDSTVNQDRPVYLSSSYANVYQEKNETVSNECENENKLAEQRQGLKPNENKHKHESLTLKLSGDDYKISDISDDSLPPSPVRTCALDNLADEPFSDTESCSSGSVITVLSMKSNDGENRTSDKLTNLLLPVNKSEHAPGHNNLSVMINDRNTDTRSKYENVSLVSGFLNDSLNSLLSANTGSEAESSSDRESSGPEVHPSEQTPELTSNEVNHEQLNGKMTSDESKESSIESLALVQEIVVSNSVILDHEAVNGHTTSLDSLNNDSELDTNVNHDAQTPVIEDYVDSDASSDSSDPPLREYDPADDDLAAFQFNLDSDDDSFFLVIGDEHDEHDPDDEGKLRNFETFTNLNSVGLCSEYGDAVTSRAVEDDARGFTFSHTEDISTEYKRRAYVTERSTLSPVTSEDEKSQQEISESPVSSPEHRPQQLLSSNSYQDATESAPSGTSDKTINDINTVDTNKPIDFNKYIIKSELSPISEHVPFIEGMSLQTGTDLINEDVLETDTKQNQRSEIDTGGDKRNTLGEENMNNLVTDVGDEETLSSLTEQIENLIHNDDCLETNVSTACVNESNSLESKQSVDNVHEIDKEDDTKTRDLTNSSKVETNIDDLFTDTIDSNTSKAGSKIETNIDDIYEANLDLTNVKTETNIDDILSDNSVAQDSSVKSPAIKKIRSRPTSRRTRATPTKSKVETNIDDVIADEAVTSSATKSKFETNIDDIFEADYVSPKHSVKVNSVHVHSTPVNHNVVTKQETHIDELLNEEQTDNRRLDVKAETPVDGLFNDPISESSDAISHKQHVNVEFIPRRLSYETFIDDLFESPTESSQSDLLPDVTSESAIPVENHSRLNTAPLRETATEGEALTVREKGVHVENSAIQLHKQSHQLNNANIGTADIPKQNNVRKVTDDSLYVSLSKTDHISDNELDKQKTKDPDHVRILTEETITDNYQRAQNDRNSRKSEHTSIPLPTDNTEYRKNVKTENQERKLDVKERVTTIGPSTKNVKNNEQLLVSDLNVSLSQFKDHNANIALPKTCNNVRNNSNIGECPENNRDLSDNQTDISLEVKTSSDNLHSLNKIQHDGISFNDIEISVDDSTVHNSYTELKIVEENEAGASNIETDHADEQLDSIGSCSLSAYSDDESLSSFEESYHSIKDTYNAIRSRGLSDSAIGRVIRTPATKPSDLFGKTPKKELKGVKRRIHQHQLKKYTSVLQQPINPEKVHVSIELPEHHTPLTRLKVERSREKFLSAENLSSDNFEDKFLKHRTSLVASTPRKYLKRHERELQSTESLPGDMSLWNASYGGNLSMDHIHTLPAPRHIEHLYNSRYSSNNSSFERSEYDKLHANCMFSPAKREEIRHTTKSLENMFEQLLRYGSVSSMAETDLDAPDIEDSFVSFQYPLERAGSMSALLGPSESSRLPRKPGKGRFANRNVPKSKSLQTLETDLDEVFADEFGQGGELKKTPSVHELRVSKSLSKLNVPDWFKRSSFSRSGSTQSLFTYAGRTGSTSTLGSCAYPPSITSSPSPSVTPGGNTVIIQKRVTPTPTTPTSTKLLRAPMLPTTPERAPIHNTPPTTILPSDKYRKKEKKELKPITIVPFAKIREMFERKAQEDAKSKKSPLTSPTKESPTKDLASPTKERPKVHFEQPTSPTSVTPVHSEPNNRAPVQTGRTISPPPPIPDRKPILSDSTRHTESVPRRPQQVHFSDDMQVSRSQEQNVDTKRQNGTTQSTSSSTLKKFTKRTASLPLPQFRFRRPGSSASKSNLPPNTSASGTQSKKGKTIVYYGDCGEYQVNYDISVNTPPPAWMHVLQNNAKIDGETLFEFLQKRRYSSILENGFAEQMDELQDRDVTFNFPVMAVSNHSSNGDAPADCSPDLRVILTNAYNNNVQNGYLDNKLRGDASVDDILDGLLLLDGHQTGRMRLDENGRIVPRTPDEFPLTPDTPPGLTLNLGPHDHYESGVHSDGDQNCDSEMMQSEYVLIKCENPQCKRETNLKEARKYFKSCHTCFTYYCSRTCRKIHWAPHKLVCIYSRINSACKHVIKFINKQPHLQYQCSRIARRGYLSQGRGCVVFAFPDIGSAEDFLTSGMECLWVPPVYISLRELPNATMLGTKLHILTETCKQYNPELKYVIHIAIVIPPRLPFRPVPRRMETIIQKCAKLRLSPAHMHPKQEDSENPTTLILTAVPGNQHSDDLDGRKTRELCFVNIQRKLRNRGVSLRHKFPNVYNRLIDFVSDAKHFSPLIIYPSDGRTGKRFMCVIMPEAEPEIEWIRDPDLFHELDVFDDDEAELSTSNQSTTLQHEIML